MGHRAWQRHYEEHDASLLSVWLLKTKPGKRREFIERLPSEDRQISGGIFGGNVWKRTRICAVDADSDDQLYLVEYWEDLSEYGNGTHAAYDGYDGRVFDELVIEKTVMFEGDPVWFQSGNSRLTEPAGIQTTLDLTS
jgi:hypothetical protein